MFNAEIPDFFVATNFFPFAFRLGSLYFSTAVFCSQCATNKEKTLMIPRCCCYCCCCCWRFCFIFVQYTQRIIDTIDKYYVCTVSLSLWYLSPMKINKLFICHLLKWNNSKNNAKSTLFFAYFLFLFK